MIWVVLFVFVAVITIYICTPLLRGRAVNVKRDKGTQVYIDKINELDQLIAAGGDDLDELEATKTALQRKTLEHVSERSPHSTRSSKSIFAGIAAVVGMSTFLLYSQIGSPELATERPNDQANSLQELEGLPLEQLVIRLEGALKTDPANPNGWIYYARSLMTLGRHDEALAAYDRALALTNSDEKIVSERASAVRYMDKIQSGSSGAENGPSAADIEAATRMSAEDRNAMVQNMVDGLSAKLVENPFDEEGWVRLLKARKVLGQLDLLAAEKDRMIEVFEGKPDTIERILSASGFDNPE